MRTKFLEMMKLCLRGWKFNKYRRISDFADAVLRVVYEPSMYELRIELLTYALTNLGFETDDSYFEAPHGNGVDDETFSRHVERFGDNINVLLSRCLRENVVPERFGRLVLDWLEALPNREAKVVALAVIFQCPLIPYVNIPDYLIGRSLVVSMADLEKPCVRKSLALLRRLFGEFGLRSASPEVFAVVVQGVLASHKEVGEIQLILARTFLWFMNYVDRQRSEKIQNMLGGAVEEVFELIRRKDGSEDEDKTGKISGSEQSKRMSN